MPQPAPAMRAEPAPAPRPNRAEQMLQEQLRERAAPANEPPAAELPFAAAPEPARSEPVPEPTRAEAPAAAAPESAAHPSPDRKKPSNFFARAASKAIDLARSTGNELRDATPSAMMTRVHKPEPPVLRPSTPPAPPPVAQTRLDLDPTDRIAARASEDDMLDIPAFLRRQAN